MGKLALAAKITHVPSMYLSELPGKHHGCREAAIEGHRIIGQRCRDLGVDTIVVSDVHWLVNAGYHVNCNARFEGVYTSNELPHFIKDMRYAYPGNPGLGRLIAETATARGVFTRAHEINSLELEYGTLVPMRYMNSDQHFKVVSIAGWCAWHQLEESRRFGAALLEAIVASDSTVAFLASGSLSHRFNDNGNRRIHPPDQPRVFQASRPARGRALEAGRLEDLLRDAARVRIAVRGRGRHARHSHVARAAWLGCL